MPRIDLSIRLRIETIDKVGQWYKVLRKIIVDHVTPLKRGGADSPSNMHWQTKEEAKVKDKWESGG